MAIVSMLYGAGGASSADEVSYDNTTSGLEADNVQDAVDEVVAELDSKGTIYRSSNTEQKIINSDPIDLTELTLEKGKYVIEIDIFGTCSSNVFFTAYLGPSENPVLYQFRMYGDSSPKLTYTIVYEVTEASETLILKGAWTTPSQNITVTSGNARIIAIKVG